MTRLLPLLALAASLAAGESWTFVNPHGRGYDRELLRIPLTLPAGAAHVTANSQWVPSQVEREGDRTTLWVAATYQPKQSLTWTIAAGEPPIKPEVLASAQRDGDTWILGNRTIAVRVPAVMPTDGTIPAPLLGLRLKDGPWLGAGGWSTGLVLKSLTATALGQGPVFGKVRLRYEFTDAGWAEITVTLGPDNAAGCGAIVEERHAMRLGDFWEFDTAAGWKPEGALVRIHGASPSGTVGLRDRTGWTLKPGQTRMGDCLVQLMPRWTQHYDQGWFFAAQNGTQAVGALAGRASRWVWPHDNLIDCRVAAAGDQAVLRLPTRRGARWWMLVAGETSRFAARDKQDPLVALVDQTTVSPLDKLAHEMITAWPGHETGGFSGQFPFTDDLNPTSMWRGLGRNALKNAGANASKADLSTLTRVQALLHPDTYGGSWTYWSPENPNFFTDFLKVPFGMTADLKQHPDFQRLARWAEFRLREDLYHSVTLPGGAGQECPGYQTGSQHGWKEMAEVGKAHLGFDATAWPQYQAAIQFPFHISQPIGEGKRRLHPGGDTHPPGKDLVRHAEEYAQKPDYPSFTSEELPGFGAVLRHRCGSERETYVAFKSGPNRGHYHGDQLSLHWCAAARPLAIDHMCSYSPRADQEHLHNRVAFSLPDLPWANLDGYERLIAFTTSALADVAVGEVENTRLRWQRERPPLPNQSDPLVDWDQRWQVKLLEKPLRYRRTVVLVKGEIDYLVLRDQFLGPAVTATFCLHVLGQKAVADGTTVRFDGLTLFQAQPQATVFAPFDWSYCKGKDPTRDWSESTKGARLSLPNASAGEFLTVLYPSETPPSMKILPDGVQVGEDTITFAHGLVDRKTLPSGARPASAVCVRRQQESTVLPVQDLDLARLQGTIGLFVPDAGYPFGDLPQWLIDQRAGRPEWFEAYRKDLGQLLWTGDE